MIRPAEGTPAPGAHKLRFCFIALIFVAVQAVVLLLGWETIGIVNAARAYATGESFYSKAQKGAVYSLRRYALSGEPSDFAAYQAALRVPLGDGLARRAMEQDRPDWAGASWGLLQGRNEPDDIAPMIRLFLWFRSWEPFATAIADWRAGDRLIGELGAQGDELRSRIEDRTLTPERRQAILDGIEATDRQLTALEDSFSKHVGEAARAATGLVTIGLGCGTLLFWALGAHLAWRSYVRGQEADRRFKDFAETASDWFWETGTSLDLTFLSARFGELTGARQEDFLRELRITIGSAEAGGNAFFRAAPRKYVAPDGSEQYWLISGQAISDTAGDFTGYRGTGCDVTAETLERNRVEAALRKLNETLEARVAERTAALEAAYCQLEAQIREREKAETALSRAHRLEAVGQLTSGVAHDFNNLLAAIMGNIELLALRCAGEPGLTRFIEGAQRAAERGARLTSQLLAFSRKQRLAPEPLDLDELLAGMAGLFRTTIGPGPEFEIRADEALWPALADATQIELAILNLVINARDALSLHGGPGHGRILVATANATLGPPQRPEEPPAGDYVMVSVTDTGPGIPESILEKVFDPFFTTKEVGKGSGLGLSQALGVAQQLGGGMRIISREGEGTAVILFLPRSRVPTAETAAAEGDERAVADCGGDRSARILVVDDDDQVRAVTVEILRERGYAVRTAASGQEALGLIETEDGRPDLLVADFAMPGMNGAELARLARRRLPGLPVLFLTGYADKSVLAADAAPEEILQKPFTAASLLARVESMHGQARMPPPTPPRLAMRAVG